MNPLHLLAEHDREREAPRRVEARVIAAFRARQRRRRAASVALGAVAAAGAVAAILLAPRLIHPALPDIRVSPPRPPAVEARRSPSMSRPSRVGLPPPAGAPARGTMPQAPPAQEVVTEFFPLMDPAPPFERGQILRVNVPASAMRTVGLPVREEHLADRIQADVLVGEEGMARAIRFVSFETK